MKKFKMPSATKIYVVIFQVTSLLMIPYLLFATDLSAAGGATFFSGLYDFSASSLPRAEMLFLSTLYRTTESEIFLYFALCIAALALGIVAAKCLSGKKSAKVFKIVCAAAIVCDLIARIFPFRFNSLFGTAPAVVGFAVRLICLALIVKDLFFGRKAEEK